MLLALDPSSSCTGWALFDGRKCIDSGAIILPDTGWWDEVLANELRAILNGKNALLTEPTTVLIEDIANRSNRNQYFGPSLFQWSKAVGVCIGALAGMVEFKRYPSTWLAGKPYAPCRLAHEKKFRIQCAQAYRPEVTQVDEATAVLFGVWSLTANPALFDWKPPKKKERRRDGRLDLEGKTLPAGMFRTQTSAANGFSRPGRGLNIKQKGSEND